MQYIYSLLLDGKNARPFHDQGLRAQQCMHWCDYSRDPSSISSSGCRINCWTWLKFKQLHFHFFLPFLLLWLMWTLIGIVTHQFVNSFPLQTGFPLNGSSLLVRKLTGQWWSPKSPLLPPLSYLLSELLLKTGLKKTAREQKAWCMNWKYQTGIDPYKTLLIKINEQNSAVFHNVPITI